MHARHSDRVAEKGRAWGGAGGCSQGLNGNRGRVEEMPLLGWRSWINELNHYREQQNTKFGTKFIHHHLPPICHCSWLQSRAIYTYICSRKQRRATRVSSRGCSRRPGLSLRAIIGSWLAQPAPANIACGAALPAYWFFMPGRRLNVFIWRVVGCPLSARLQDGPRGGGGGGGWGRGRGAADA